MKSIVITDMQNYFINRHTKDLPDKIDRYLHKNKTKFNYILFTQFINAKDTNFVKLLNWRKCFGPPDTNIHEKLHQYVTKENIFVKHSYSPFKSPKFRAFLKKHKIKEIVICGNDRDKNQHKIGCKLIKENLESNQKTTR